MVENEQSQIETQDKDYNQEFAFNIISIKKFWILHILSFGFFSYAFMYLNIKKQKEIINEDISPFWRAFFYEIWIFGLALRIKEQSKIEKIRNWNATGSAIIAFVLTWVGNSFSGNFEIDTIEKLAFLYLALFIILLIKGFIYTDWQKKINLSSDDVKGLTNDKLTLTNFLWLLIPWCLFGGAFVYGIFY